MCYYPSSLLSSPLLLPLNCKHCCQLTPPQQSQPLVSIVLSFHFCEISFFRLYAEVRPWKHLKSASPRSALFPMMLLLAVIFQVVRRSYLLGIIWILVRIQYLRGQSDATILSATLSGQAAQLIGRFGEILMCQDNSPFRPKRLNDSRGTRSFLSMMKLQIGKNVSPEWQSIEAMN